LDGVTLGTFRGGGYQLIRNVSKLNYIHL
jgi:hypothetical protein